MLEKSTVIIFFLISLFIVKEKTENIINKILIIKYFE